MPLCPAGHESAADDYCDSCGRRMGAPAAPRAPVAASPAAGGPTWNEPAGGEPSQPSCPVCHTPRSGRFCEVCRFDFVAGAPTTMAPAPDRRAAGAAGGTPAAPGAAPAEGSRSAPGVATGSAPGVAAEATPAGQPGGTAGPSPASAASADGTAWSAVVTADRAYFDRVIVSGRPAAEIRFPDYCPERRFALGRPRAGEEKRIGRYSASRGIDPEIDLTGPPTDPGVSRLHAVLIGQPEGGWALVDPGSENGTLVNDQEIATGVPVPLHDGDRIHLGAWTVITIRRG
jgi:FHA domain